MMDWVIVLPLSFMYAVYLFSTLVCSLRYHYHSAKMNVYFDSSVNSVLKSSDKISLKNNPI